jgi:phage gp37-like protein
LAFFPSIVLAADPSALRASDLLCLKKALHNANQAQLEQQYQIYDDQMMSYLTDLPSCLNIWMNVNEIRRKHKETVQTSAILSLDMLVSKADNAMTEHIATARTARQNLIKITSVEALKQVDKNHQWDLPASVSQIRPAAGITKAKDLSPQILRQIPK